MEFVVLFFLFFSTFAYILLGGADFGVGILEFFSNKKNQNISKQTAYRIIGPVWEANHIWLILIIVIMWICYPLYYNVVVTQLHIPISLVLVGIIGRGTAFVFRHYDAYKDESQKLYDRIFQISSVFTPFMLGIVFGALLSGRLTHPEQLDGGTFLELHVLSWLNLFSLSTGIFTVVLFAYISSFFIVSETTGEEKKYFERKLDRSTIMVIFSGVLVFATSFIYFPKFSELIFKELLTYVLIAIVTGLVILSRSTLKRENRIVPKVILAVQVFFIFATWVIPMFPNLILFQEGEIGLMDNASPEIVFTTMGWALIGASIFVLPGLYHLFKTFGLLSK